MKARKEDLQKIGRLLKRADFLRIQAAVGGGKGRKWVTPHVIIQMTERPQPVIPAQAGIYSADKRGSVIVDPGLRRGDAAEKTHSIRLGLTVTKKIFPRAVDRNRVRRRVRALFLSVIGDFPGAAGYDFVLLPRHPVLKAEAKELEKDMKWALKRLTTPDLKGKNENKG